MPHTLVHLSRCDRDARGEVRVSYRSGGGQGGGEEETPLSLRTRLKVKNPRGIVFKVCCTVHEGHKRPKRSVTNVVNTQDSQEQAPCAAYGFLGLIQVPYEAPVYNVGLPKDRYVGCEGVGTGLLCPLRGAGPGSMGGYGMGLDTNIWLASVNSWREN
eukprot:1178782-Prorocentrum_minimum.AAC.2